MSHTSNLPTSPPPLADATPGKLKRLSLASKPALGDVDRDVDAGIGAGVREGAGPSTPRRSGRGLRSSISYSPALVWSSVMPQREIGIGSGASRDGNVSGVRGSMDGFGRGGIREESPIERASAWSDTGRDGGEVREKQGGRRTQTLTDKHSDLLTLIAQRERRVNELRQELGQQEASLNTLKSRWASIISRSSSLPTPHHPTSIPPTSILTSSRPVSASSSTSSQISLLASPPTTEEVPTFAGLLQSTLGPSEEAIEGGKRFWGQLVRTVSAAAGGTVPVEGMITGTARKGEEGDGLVGRLDLSGLKIMLPAWAGVVTSPTLPPPRPANASRLPGREMRQLSTSGSSGDSGSVRSLMDDEEECLGDGEGVMTPRMEGKGEVKVVSEDGKEEGEVEAWGWL